MYCCGFGSLSITNRNFYLGPPLSHYQFLIIIRLPAIMHYTLSPSHYSKDISKNITNIFIYDKDKYIRSNE